VAAIRVCLAQLDPGVVGVLASLATVQSDDLARALGAGCSSALATLVLTDGATRQRLSAVLSAKKLRRCDMLALSMINNFRGDTGAGDRTNCRCVAPMSYRIVRRLNEVALVLQYTPATMC
jgi:chromosome segregation ATPase